MHYVSLPPSIVFLLVFFGLWFAAWLGARLRQGSRFNEERRNDLGLILAAALTLLGLLIGFSFSMAASRYDQRKNLEEAEANAIGTEYLRADLLPAADRARVRDLLKRYVDLRIRNYVTRGDEMAQIDAETAKLQGEMWLAVVAPAAAQPNPVVALVVSGMNDVINAQGYTQAAWWNRIAFTAMVLLAAISIGCSLLLGYGSPSVAPRSPLFMVLPLLVAIAVALIVDLDSPRRGLVHVTPQNLISLQKSLKTP